MSSVEFALALGWAAAAAAEELPPPPPLRRPKLKVWRAPLLRVGVAPLSSAAPPPGCESPENERRGPPAEPRALLPSPSPPPPCRGVAKADGVSDITAGDVIAELGFVPVGFDRAEAPARPNLWLVDVPAAVGPGGGVRVVRFSEETEVTLLRPPAAAAVVEVRLGVFSDVTAEPVATADCCCCVGPAAAAVREVRAGVTCAEEVEADAAEPANLGFEAVAEDEEAPTEPLVTRRTVEGDCARGLEGAAPVPARGEAAEEAAPPLPRLAVRATAPGLRAAVRSGRADRREGVAAEAAAVEARGCAVITDDEDCRVGAAVFAPKGARD